MRRLYLLRHAKSSWDDPSLPDQERPLARRGRKAAGRIAGFMRRRGILPRLVLCSSSRRTRETLELIRPALASAEIAIEEALYAAGAAQILERLRRVPEGVESVLVIGHNPGLQDLGYELAHEGRLRGRLLAGFATSALATLEIRTAGWSGLGPGTAELVELVAPRELPAE